jgi:hypothetical protein
MNRHSILRWIAILLMAALPVRSGLAAMQFCPWMDQHVGAATMVPLQHMTAESADCAEMAGHDGDCQLQKACMVTPILTEVAPGCAAQAHTERITNVIARSATTLVSVPERIPITGG